MYLISRPLLTSHPLLTYHSSPPLLPQGYVTLASHWLKMEAAATTALAKPAEASEEPEFYKAKVQTSAFVFDRLLPRCASHKEIMLAPVSSSTDLAPGDFSFDHSR